MPAQDRAVKDSVCLNHPGRPAAYRCTVCFKPVCADCAIQGDDGVFCSPSCVSNFERTKGSVDAWHQQRRRDQARRRRNRLIKLIILIALAAVAYYYFSRNPGKLDQLKDKAGKAVDEVKRDVAK